MAGLLLKASTTFGGTPVATIELRFLIGTWSTGTKAITAVPFVCDATPGLVSPLDRPLGRMLS